jgi:hypothetical protein
MSSAVLLGSGRVRISWSPSMSSLSTRRARCRLPMCWPMRRLEGVSFCWAIHSNWNNRKSDPEGSGISALAHLLDGRRAIGETQGLFLRETWRLHPAICDFTSELDGSSRSMVLSDRISKLRHLSAVLVCGLCQLSMKAIRAIRQKKLSGSSASLNTSRGLALVGPTATAIGGP